MFSKKDFDHIQKMNNEMADGFVDASDSHDTLESIVNILSTTDFLSEDSRMQLMMRCINLCYMSEDNEDVMYEDSVFAVVLALCFNYCNVMSNLVEDGFDVSQYYDFLKSEVLPMMKEDSKALPYWELDEN